MEQTEKILSEEKSEGYPMRMNKKFIIAFACCATVVDWILLFILVGCFDDQFPGDPPPGIFQMAISGVLLVLGFPVYIVSFLLKRDPPYFFASCTFLFFLGGIVWGMIVEKFMQWKRRHTVSKNS